MPMLGVRPDACVAFSRGNADWANRPAPAAVAKFRGLEAIARRTVKPQTLPNWARMLAGPMPKTTARMLELDAMHRSGDRLDARLRCLVRWAAADANGCAYSKAMAAGDLKRARNADADLAQLVNHPEQLPALDRAAVAFARKMMREAHSVTDNEVKQLLNLAGEERLVALVTLIAHSSFQDHLFLAMNVPPDPADGVPPLQGQFTRISIKQPAGASRVLLRLLLRPGPALIQTGCIISRTWSGKGDGMVAFAFRRARRC